MSIPFARTLGLIALCVAPWVHAQEVVEIGASTASSPAKAKTVKTATKTPPPAVDDRPDILSVLAPQDIANDPMDDAATELAFRAVQYLGIPYRSGGSSPAGFDCSGLVKFVFNEVLGARLPHRADQIVRVGQPLKTADLAPGDLVFYNTMGRRYSHVGIYLGDNRFIHAPSSGGVVRIENMDMAYWKKRFNGARRIDVAALSTTTASR